MYKYFTIIAEIEGFKIYIPTVPLNILKSNSNFSVSSNVQLFLINFRFYELLGNLHSFVDLNNK